MNTRTLTPVVAVLFAAFTLASVCHAQTNRIQSNVVLTLKMSTNGLTNWQTVQTVVTNMPASLQAFYRMEIVTSDVASPPSVPTNMVLIPVGSFSMGNNFGDGGPREEPVHTVYVSAFYMDKYEVTKALWDEVANWAATNGYDINAATASGKAANHPVHTMAWDQAVKWSNARSEKEGLTPCYTVGGAVMRTGYSAPDCNFAANGYRLPTEAEWEKAARGGLSGKRFPWGDTITHSQANYYSDRLLSYDVSPTQGFHPTYTTGDITPYSSPVGSFAASGYGLYDMAGNMWEFVWDWYSEEYYASSPGSDPRGPSSGSARVIRGGSWYDEAVHARTTHRDSRFPTTAINWVGFRCARTLVP